MKNVELWLKNIKYCMESGDYELIAAAYRSLLTFESYYNNVYKTSLFMRLIGELTEGDEMETPKSDCIYWGEDSDEGGDYEICRASHKKYPGCNCGEVARCQYPRERLRKIKGEGYDEI
jgi:hypothetical protein